MKALEHRLIILITLTFYYIKDTKEEISATNLIVKDYGVGYDEFILLFNNQIQENGYLTDWRYFVKREAACNTYVTIWRQQTNRTSTYEKVYQLKLPPYIWKYLIKTVVHLQIGDLISTFVDKRPDESCTSLVSYRTNETESDPVAYVVHGLFYAALAVTERIDIGLSTLLCYNRHGGLVDHKKFSILPTAVGLQAIMEKYVALDTAPYASHSSTQSAGEITVAWNAYYSTDSSVKIYGYRVICSTKRVFPPEQSSVRCNKTTGARTTSLLGLDITEPLYAGIQILRIINGQMGTDMVFSNISTVFCPERRTLSSGEVTITEISAASEKHTNLSVSLALKSLDNCVGEWSVTLRGPNTTTTASVPKASSVLYVSAEPGYEHSISILFKLVDGHEAKVFEGKYQAKPMIVVTASTGEEKEGEEEITTSQNRKRLIISVATTFTILALIVTILCLLILWKKMKDRGKVQDKDKDFTTQESPAGETPSALDRSLMEPNDSGTFLEKNSLVIGSVVGKADEPFEASKEGQLTATDYYPSPSDSLAPPPRCTDIENSSTTTSRRKRRKRGKKGMTPNLITKKASPLT